MASFFLRDKTTGFETVGTTMHMSVVQTAAIFGAKFD